MLYLHCSKSISLKKHSWESRCLEQCGSSDTWDGRISRLAAANPGCCRHVQDEPLCFSNKWERSKRIKTYTLKSRSKNAWKSSFYSSDSNKDIQNPVHKSKCNEKDTSWFLGLSYKRHKTNHCKVKFLIESFHLQSEI